MESKGTTPAPVEEAKWGPQQMGSPAAAPIPAQPEYQQTSSYRDPQQRMEEGKGTTTPDPVEEGKWGPQQMGSPATAPPAQPENQETAAFRGKQEHMKEGKGTTTPDPVEKGKWGTRQMGAPAAPPSHPENEQAAAYWGPHRGDEDRPPYILIDSAPQNRQGTGGSPMETIFDAFNSWTRKAETLAGNVWLNLKTAPSMTNAAWGKVSLTAKALTEGGYETIYRQTFPSETSDRVKKTFACYLSTAKGPVAGTLYLTTANVAFCSDRPLSFTAPSGQETWSYYKVLIPLRKLGTVNPVTVKENPPEKYIQIATVDGHEFWFMGFVSYDKASTHLLNAVHDEAAAASGQQTAASGQQTAASGQQTAASGQQSERAHVRVS